MKRKTEKIIFGALTIAIGLSLALIAAVMAWFRMEGKTNGAIVTSGETCNCLLYVPKTYDPSRPTPLLISLHPAAARPAVSQESGPWSHRVWDSTSDSFPI
jgi:poly(3-hydroxybutyrate) depolymerase